MKSTLDIRLEDQHLVVVNKPAGVLSQPGKTMDGSIATQIKESFPEADGPMLVHRLDMDTSGLMVFAKSRDVHRHLQQQFEHRKISKRYNAVVNARPHGSGGRILLPLRLDVDNRPSQIVCFEHGKPSTTIWQRAEEIDDAQTRILFTPITGRTHQLRVHAAHKYGLNAAIVGDRLYGSEAQRLMLHADTLGFWHPVTGIRTTVFCEATF